MGNLDRRSYRGNRALKAFRTFGLVCTTLLLVACLEGVELDPLPALVNTQNDPPIAMDVQPPELAPAPSPDQAEQTVSTPAQLSEQPPAYDQTGALARLTPATQFTYRFLSNDQIVEEILPVSASDISLDSDGSGASLETNVFIGERLICRFASPIYLCFRLFPTGSAVFNAFELNAYNQGNGAFEVCPAGISLEECTDNFVASPDGALSVRSGIASSTLPYNDERYQVQGGAYLDYLKQSALDEPNELTGNFPIDSMHINQMLLTATDHTLM